MPFSRVIGGLPMMCQDPLFKLCLSTWVYHAVCEEWGLFIVIDYAIMILGCTFQVWYFNLCQSCRSVYIHCFSTEVGGYKYCYTRISVKKNTYPTWYFYTNYSKKNPNLVSSTRWSTCSHSHKNISTRFRWEFGLRPSHQKPWRNSSAVSYEVY